MSLNWNDSYRVGDADIDAQHQELFVRANKFLSASDKAGLMASAMSLFKYTREHFAHEESLMKRIGYPSMSAHVQQHDELIRKLNLTAQRIADETLDTQHLEAFLHDWLLNHIGASDTKLAEFVKLEMRKGLPGP